MCTVTPAVRSPGLVRADARARCLALHGVLGMAALLCSTATVHAAPAEVAAPVAQAAGLGALFYTPAQRQRISQARRGGASGDDAAITGAVRLDGMVRHARGTTTVFINGQEAGPHLASTGAAVNIEAQGVRLDARTRLVVGQSVVPGAGNAPQDLVPAGSVVSGRTPRADSTPASGTLRLLRSQPATGQP